MNTDTPSKSLITYCIYVPFGGCRQCRSLDLLCASLKASSRFFSCFLCLNTSARCGTKCCKRWGDREQKRRGHFALPIPVDQSPNVTAKSHRSHQFLAETAQETGFAEHARVFQSVSVSSFGTNSDLQALIVSHTLAGETASRNSRSRLLN